MGEDFTYQNAHEYFLSLDNMISYWNDNYMDETNIEFIYSTPQMYVDAIAAEEITWPTKYDDLFPYADNDAGYWTGYFTSRANDKKYIRDASHSLHASNKLYALYGINQYVGDDEVEQMVEAKDTLFDVVGVV